MPPLAQDSVARKTVTLRITGMTCGGCTIAVRKVLTKLDGVAQANVSYERAQAMVSYDPAKVTVAQMVAAVKTLGYTATAARAGTDAGDGAGSYDHRPT